MRNVIYLFQTMNTHKRNYKFSLIFDFACSRNLVLRVLEKLDLESIGTCSRHSHLNIIYHLSSSMQPKLFQCRCN